MVGVTDAGNGDSAALLRNLDVCDLLGVTPEEIKNFTYADFNNCVSRAIDLLLAWRDSESIWKPPYVLNDLKVLCNFLGGNYHKASRVEDRIKDIKLNASNGYFSKWNPQAYVPGGGVDSFRLQTGLGRWQPPVKDNVMPPEDITEFDYLLQGTQPDSSHEDSRREASRGEVKSTRSTPVNVHPREMIHPSYLFPEWSDSASGNSRYDASSHLPLTSDRSSSSNPSSSVEAGRSRSSANEHSRHSSSDPDTNISQPTDHTSLHR